MVEKSYGQGIGIVYTAITNDILNFGIGEAGKTMALAAFGKNVKGSKILNLNPTYSGLVTDYSEFINRAPYYKLKKEIKKCERREDVMSEFYAKIAYELQDETEKCMVYLANYAYKITGKKNLCIAGGVGLNCVANSKILEKSPFEKIFIQPASSDAGIPFGLALCGYTEFKKSSRIYFNHAFTGVSYNGNETTNLLNGLGIKYNHSNPKEVARLLSEGKIIGWFIEGSEFGPRALGHRSIIADPRYLNMKDVVNAKVKHREMFRPFAPSILEEDASSFFYLTTGSPFMLLAPAVKENKAEEIPAVIHVDGTARVQTVSEIANKVYYNLIKNFKEITGVPVILNTSFNDNDEPVVETPIDAVLCFLRTEIDCLYLDGLLIKKEDIESVESKISCLTKQRNDSLKKYYREAINILCDGYSTEEMLKYLKTHYPMHKYYTDLHTYVLLQEEIHKRIHLYDNFVTDEYHIEIIRNFMKEEFNMVSSKLLIVDDCYKNVRTIPFKSFVVLYNLSLYIKDESIFNFYEDKSLIILKSLFNVYEVFKNDLSVSNEYKLTKDWDRFYKGCIKE